MTDESIYFEWLTFTWLMDNLVWICVFMIISMAILFFFPLLLGYSILDETEKKEANKSLNDQEQK